jgi:hypothetical protein
MCMAGHDKAGQTRLQRGVNFVSESSSDSPHYSLPDSLCYPLIALRMPHNPLAPSIPSPYLTHTLQALTINPRAFY